MRRCNSSFWVFNTSNSYEAASVTVINPWKSEFNAY
jgi:hypothetical protein